MEEKSVRNGVVIDSLGVQLQVRLRNMFFFISPARILSLWSNYLVIPPRDGERTRTITVG